MRILLVTPMLPSKDGPGAIPMLLHAQLLALIPRHEVTLITGIGDEAWEAEAACSLPQGLRLYIADRRRPANRWRRLTRQLEMAFDWLLTDRPWRAVWFGSRPVRQVVRMALDRDEFDVMVVEDVAMAAVVRSATVPMLLTEHEVRRTRPVAVRHGRIRGASMLKAWDWRKTQQFGPRVWSRYDLLQVFTEADGAEILRRAPSLAGRVRVNPFGIEASSRDQPSPAESYSILFVGNFTHPPNCDAAVWLVREIMPVVWASARDAKLRIVGSHPPSDVLQLNGPRVEVVADVPSVEAYLEQATVCIAPVRQGGGMRMKVLSAMAAGKPVVATHRGAEGFEAAGNAILISDYAEGLAAQVVRVLEDDELRRELGRLARDYVQRQHSPEAWGRRLDAVYGELAR
jgi:glycosyltransferase involved in cell wall biosynthesis